jgi:hypothetical protein
MTGAFASDAEYASLLQRLETGAIRPKLFIVGAFASRAPAAFLLATRAGFRPDAAIHDPNLLVRIDR